MPDHAPEPWQTDASAPFLTIETPRGVAEMWALGEDRFTVKAPGYEQLVKAALPPRAAEPRPERCVMAAKLEKTKTPDIFKRGSRYVFSYRVDGRQKWEAARGLDEARRAKVESSDRPISSAASSSCVAA